ncbi:alpha/beta hydrolase family protein [Bacteriovorax sp. BSW11_IV]|nr:alpha/beta hydrolase family protein [Bacteriovorax sp. BSW11_IV]
MFGSSFALDVPFPALSGQFAVTSQTIVLKDHSRTDVMSKYGDKSPECSANENFRRIPLTIYAPTNTHDHRPNKYLPKVLTQFMGLPENMASIEKRSFEMNEFTVLEKPKAVIFFSPGLGISSLFYTALLEEVASHGYLIFAFSHPYMSGNVYDATKNCIVPMIDLPIERNPLVKLLGEMIEENIKDFSFVRNFLSKYKIDMKKFFMMGHSGGGMSATYYCDKFDSNCTGVINLDGGDINGIGIEVDGAWPVDKKLSFLKIHSASFPNLDRIQDRDFGEDQYLVDIKRIDHQTFSDKAFFPGMVGHEGDDLLAPFLSQLLINEHVLSFLKARSSSKQRPIEWPSFDNEINKLFTKRHLK